LFAAVVTAFLVFTMTKLQADSSDISKDILLHMSLQLSNSSIPAFVEPEFSVASHWAVVNALLFASLALVLVDAYLAVLTRGWLRDFDRGWKSSNVPEERARKREMRLQGLQRWKLHWVVALLPLLIQASLVLYFISLVLMLIHLYRPIAYPTLAILAVGFCSYLSTIAISTLDTNAPFTSLDSKVLQALTQWSRLKWRSWRATHENTDGAKGELGGSDIHLAISNRLCDATSNAVENLPIFMEIFDQRMHTPSLHLHKASDWSQVFPLVQPYLSNESHCGENTLRSVARLFLCFNSKEFRTGRQAVIKALEKHNAGIERLYIHLHQSESDRSLAYQLVPNLEANKHTIIELRWILDWFVSGLLMKNQEFPNERDSPCIFMHDVTFLCSTTVYIIQNRIMDDDHGLFDSLLLVTKLIAERSQRVDAILPNMGLRTSSGSVDGEPQVSISASRESRWQVISDLHTMSCTSTAGFKHNFRLLIMLLVISMGSAVKYSDIYDGIAYDLFTNPERDLPKLMDILWETWNSLGPKRPLLVRIAARLLQRDGSLVHKSPPNAQQSVQDLLEAYDSYTSESILLMTSNGLLFIEAMLSFILTGDSKWEPQTAKLSNPWLVMHIHNVLRRDWYVPAGSEMREAVWGRLDPLGRPVWLDKWIKWLDRLDQLLTRLKQFTQLKVIGTHRPSLHMRLLRLDPRLKQIDLRLKKLKKLKWLDQLSPRDPLFEQFGWLDRFNPLLELLSPLDPLFELLIDQFNPLAEHLNQLEPHHTWIKSLDQQLVEQLERLDHRLDQQFDQQLDQLDQQLKQLDQQLDKLDLDQQLHQVEQQRSTVLGMIAKSRIDLYNTKTLLRPDLVPLGLFLSPRNTDLCNDSRRLILELCSPSDTTKPEVVDARALCSDFFDSKAIGDLTKWRLLYLMVFQEWETISTEWKELLAAEVLKVDRVDDKRVDWMARVTPLLVGEFNLSEFMVAEGSNSDSVSNGSDSHGSDSSHDADSHESGSDSTYGSLAPLHVRMVAIIVEYLGAERLTYQMTCELEKFLEQHSHILCDQKALGRIRVVIRRARTRYSESGIPLVLVDSDVITASPSRIPLALVDSDGLKDLDGLSDFP
jgi:hypothetical protein